MHVYLYIQCQHTINFFSGLLYLFKSDHQGDTQRYLWVLSPLCSVYWLCQWLLSVLPISGYTIFTWTTRLVLMTPPAGKGTTSLLASPSTWPSQEPSTTTTPSPSSSSLENTSCTMAVRLSSGTCPSWPLWVMVVKVR